MTRSITQPDRNKTPSTSSTYFLLIALAMLVAVLTTGVMALFLNALDWLIALWGGHAEQDFETLARWQRFTLPVFGSLLLVGLFRITPKSWHRVGVAQVLDRLSQAGSKLPWGNVLFQFIAALIALASGQSVGKEGPAVHLGAGIANQTGQLSNLVSSQLRLLTACGVAAAIAATFNTPLAGVLFAMEVVLMEYSLLGFAPIIAAAVTAAVVSQWWINHSPTLVLNIDLDPMAANLFLDITALLVVGVFIGLVALVFHLITGRLLVFSAKPLFWRLLCAGLATGLLAIWVPEVLGMGFDTMAAVLNQQLVWQSLGWILLAKLLATSCAIGLGMPAGLIGPILVMGACAGGLFGALLSGWVPSAEVAFYALLGMAAMMSAVLHAPLAALAAVLELSLNANIMFPAMVMILAANITCQHVFKQPSIFRSLLKAQGLSIETHPMRVTLAQRSLSELARFDVPWLHSLTEAHLVQALNEASPHYIFSVEKVAYLLTHEALQSLYNEWLANERAKSLADLIATLLTNNRQLMALTTDITLLKAVNILSQQDQAGFLLTASNTQSGLVSRAQLVHELTLEGGMY